LPVRERGWTRGESRVRPRGAAALVIARYGLMGVFASRLFLAFYVVCLMPSLVAILAVYLSHSTTLIEQVPSLQEWLVKAPAWIFAQLFGWQAMPAFLIAVMAAPPLVAADLDHNAITLILSRPVTRPEYIVGKLGVLIVLLSPLTWLPALALCGLQVMLEKASWLVANARIPIAYLIGHAVWILVISLFGLAVSSRVRHAAVARGVMLAVLVIGSGTGSILNQLTRTAMGDLIRLPLAIESVAMSLLGEPRPSGLPVACSWMSLAAVAAISLWILNRRLRACEEVA
jgi:ABC-type transport system involved in multi-copper enzyme maturation permease subunit